MRPPFSFQALDFGTLMEEDAIVRYEERDRSFILSLRTTI
jgi:hypothetical protein